MENGSDKNMAGGQGDKDKRKETEKDGGAEERTPKVLMHSGW